MMSLNRSCKERQSDLNITITTPPSINGISSLLQDSTNIRMSGHNLNLIFHRGSGQFTRISLQIDLFLHRTRNNAECPQEARDGEKHLTFSKRGTDADATTCTEGKVVARVSIGEVGRFKGVGSVIDVTFGVKYLMWMKLDMYGVHAKELYLPQD